MKTVKYIAFLLGLIFLAQFHAGDAAAQATRTWISGVGDDANPCSRTAPCKTFAGAISKTAAGGEINTLDSGGFGGVTITKSISLVADGVLAGVLVAGTNAIVINAAATDVVTISGLDIEGLSKTGTPGLSAIKILSAGRVQIEGCKIRDFSVAGVDIAPAAAGVKVAIDRTSIINTKTAVLLTAPTFASTVTVARSTLTGNLTSGVEPNGANATAIVHDSTIIGSQTAFRALNGGKLLSFANNALIDNASNGTATGIGVLK